MVNILVAEDSRTQAFEIQFTLEKAGHSVRIAVDGDAAVDVIKQSPPEILLTDMHMPGKNGLELTGIVRESLPGVPVVLMTADGSENLAVEALCEGASHYIPKRMIDRDLVRTINDIAASIEARQNQESLLGALTHAEATYTFGNDRKFASTLISKFESDLQHINFDDDTGTFRIVTALKEAILNAIDHGNLELDSSLRDNGRGEEFYELGDLRATQEPYCHRKVTVTSRVSPEQLAYVISDEGPGFNPSALPDPEDPEQMLRAHGRGLLLIRSFMDDVVFNEKGNQITLIKYRVDPAIDTSDEPPRLEEQRKLRILLAEDSTTNQVLANSLLSREGHTVTVASNGDEAVTFSTDEEFDLILMDLEMPVMGGLAATKEIRQREELSSRNVPIIAMTAHDSAEDIQRCYDVGMQGHIPKPIQADTLNAAVAELDQGSIS